MIYPLKNHRRTDWFNNPNFGSGTTKRKYGPHSGIDLVSEDKTVYTPEGMTIEAWYYHDVSGWTLKARNGKRQHKFYHLRKGSLKVKVGSKVKQGDKLAIYGNTGSGSNGAHLHWSVLESGVLIDPEKYMKSEPSSILRITPLSRKIVTKNRNKGEDTVQLWDLRGDSWQEFKSVYEYSNGTTLQITGSVKHKLGGVYYTIKDRRSYYGVNIADTDKYIPTKSRTSTPELITQVRKNAEAEDHKSAQTPTVPETVEVAPSTDALPETIGNSTGHQVEVNQEVKDIMFERNQPIASKVKAGGVGTAGGGGFVALLLLVIQERTDIVFSNTEVALITTIVAFVTGVVAAYFKKETSLKL